MYENLLRISKKQNNSLIFFGIFMLIICIVLFFSIQIFWVYSSIRGDFDFNLTYQQMQETDLKSDYKEFSTPYLLDCFAVYNMGFSSLPSREYAALYFPPDSDAPVLMAIEVPWYKYSKAERIYEAAYNAQDNYNYVDTAEFYTAKGSVRKMSEQELALFEQTYGDWEVEWLPYIICDGKMSYLRYDGSVSENTPIIYLGGVLFLALAIWFLFSGIKSNKLICDTSGLKEEFEQVYGEDSFDAACNDCEFNGHCIADKIYLSKNWIAFAKNKPVILPLNKIVWIYKETTRVNFIKSSTDIIIKTIDNKSYNIRVRDKGEIDQLREWMPTEYPIVFGYNEKIAAIYRKNPEHLRELGEGIKNNG